MSSASLPITIAYQADLDDFADSATRQFLRSKTARRNRISSTVIGGVFPGLLIFLILRAHPLELLIFGSAVGGVVGAATNFFLYKSKVRKRLRKYFQREHGAQIPSETIFVLQPGSLSCQCLGVKVEFSLADLESVSEDSGRIEFFFGAKGLATMPVRVFAGEPEKTAFLDALAMERNRLKTAGGPV